MAQPVYAPPESKSRAGCWLTLSLTVFIVVSIAFVALFLPPLNLYERLSEEPYAPLNRAGDSLQSEDGRLQIRLMAEGQDFGVRIDPVAAGDISSPAVLALQSAVYGLKTKGTLAGELLLTLALPTSNLNPDVLDVYGWYAGADNASGAWRFVPAQLKNGQFQASVTEAPAQVAIFQAAPVAPQVLVAYPINRALTQDVAEVSTIIAPAGLQPTMTGSITGSLAPGFDLNARYQVMPALRDYVDAKLVDTETVPAILNNPILREQHAREVAAMVNAGGFDGVLIDYRGISAEDRDSFSIFITELGKALAQTGRDLVVRVPAAENVQGMWETGAYDWQAIGQAATFVQIDLPLNPMLYLPGEGEPVDAMLRYALREISRYKILMGLSAQSIQEENGQFTRTGYDAGLAAMGKVRYEAAVISETGSVEPGTEIRAQLDGMVVLDGVDTRINAPYLDYLDANGVVTRRVWLTTGHALRYRMDKTLSFAPGGVGFDDLMKEDIAGDIFEAVTQYQQQIPAAPAANSLALRWQIQGNDGAIIGEQVTGLNDMLVVTLNAPDGNYAIRAVVEGAGQSEDLSSVRDGVEVAQFRPTATPTPLPTATFTPVPTVTPTPIPIIPTASPVPLPGAADTGTGTGGVSNAAAPPVNPGSVALPGAGSISLSGFEYGGHVANPASSTAHGAMQRAGMRWMKYQVRYLLGQGTGDAVRAIQSAHGAGFKIMIGAVGIPNEVASMGGAYNREFANWVGQIAAAGADAIEIWNEPNLAREWPEGQISGGAYTNLLRESYQAIKAANASTIVISGAPAPTGAELAYPGKVVNDDRFLRDMVASGALQYADCVGLHYNEGIVSPTQNSGDPRDNYYTRYMGTILNIYWNIIGGQRPICITELGYLTRDGYPDLPAGFTWASNTTLQQHASWLAQAVSLASQSGQVQLLIVWNVDFTAYGGDPQGGYAIIRPGGACPACDALAASR